MASHGPHNDPHLGAAAAGARCGTRAGNPSPSTREELLREALAELVIENRMLRIEVEVWRSLEAHGSGRLYENLASNAGLEPEARRVNEDIVERVLAQIYEGHDG